MDLSLFRAVELTLFTLGENYIDNEKFYRKIWSKELQYV